MTLLGPILIVGFVVLAIFIGISDISDKKILVADETGFFNKELKESGSTKYTYQPTVLTTEEFLKSDYDLMIYVNKEITKNKVAELFYKKVPDANFQTSILNQLNKVVEKILIKQNGKIDFTEYERIKAGISLKKIDAENHDNDRDKRAIVGFAFAFLIYLFIFLYGAQVMRGVIEEKTSRVVEVIVSSVKPFQLMMGKIIGIMLVGLTQFFLWVILIFVLMIVAKSLFFNDMYDPANADQAMQIAQNINPNMTEFANESEVYTTVFSEINYPLMIGLFVFYFIGGYLLYGALFAAIGSAVDSEADTQQFMLPITVPLIFSFIISQMGIQNPDGNALTYASIIPFTSPISMMVRVPMGFESGTVWQLFLSMFLLIVTFIFTTWLAGKIYRTGILMYGKKTSYKELWKWIRYKG